MEAPGGIFPTHIHTFSLPSHTLLLPSQGLLNVGLQFTEASRGSFLTQLSVVLTPVISIFAGQKVRFSNLDISASACVRWLARDRGRESVKEGESLRAWEKILSVCMCVRESLCE